ncbi:MAG: trigger factor family protein, partial [Allobaculum sp.]
MKQNFERNGNTLELTLVYDQAETKKAENKIVSNYAKSMNVPGFRKGKTPASVVRKMLTREQLDYNLADSLQVYRELDTFLDEHDETVLDVAITEMATKDGEYTVVAKIEYPEPMEIKNWEKLATKETKTIEDDAVEKFINNLYDVEDNYEFTDDEETEVAG